MWPDLANFRHFGTILLLWTFGDFLLVTLVVKFNRHFIPSLMNSVTRFGEFLTLWYNFKSIWQKYDPTVVKMFYYWASFYCCRWPNTLKLFSHLVTLLMTLKSRQKWKNTALEMLSNKNSVTRWPDYLFNIWMFPSSNKNLSNSSIQNLPK